MANITKIEFHDGVRVLGRLYKRNIEENDINELIEIWKNNFYLIQKEILLNSDSIVRKIILRNEKNIKEIIEEGLIDENDVEKIDFFNFLIYFSKTKKLISLELMTLLMIWKMSLSDGYSLFFDDNYEIFLDTKFYDLKEDDYVESVHFNILNGDVAWVDGKKIIKRERIESKW